MAEMSGSSFRLFRRDGEALFVSRPNRFLILARLLDGKGRAAGEVVPCHCPNPGRLLEFVIPGTRLILEHRKGEGRAKTSWTVVGLYYRKSVVPFYSARANAVARELLIPAFLPGLRELKGEHSIENSRFDFLALDAEGTRHLIEVKACSLVEEGVAMFPDAPSLRATKHLEELATLSKAGYRCHVLFVIVHGRPHRFIPNLHTDPAFATAVTRYADFVEIHTALIQGDREGRVRLVSDQVPVDLSYGALAAQDRGSYLILLELTDDRTLEIGALGPRRFQRGWYVYAGSAQRALGSRIARHLRKVRKQKHWHFDYLTPWAEKIKALPIASYVNLECSLAVSLKALGGKGVEGFGSSDCGCKSHLFYFQEAPLKNRAFVALLFHFRHTQALIRL